MQNNQSSECHPKSCYNNQNFFPTIIVFMIDHRCHGRVLEYSIAVAHSDSWTPFTINWHSSPSPPTSVSGSPASWQTAASEAGKILIQHPHHQHWSCSGLGSLPSAWTTVYLKSPLSSSWSLQMTPHWSASFRTVTSLLTDRRLRSWLSGAVLTTWSLTCSKQWRWSWTSGETPCSPQLTIMNSTVTAVESFRFLGTTISQDLKWYNHRPHCEKDPAEVVHPSPVEEVQPATGAVDTVLLCNHWIRSLHVNICLVQLSYQIWPQKTTEGSPDCGANHWYNPLHSPRTLLIQSEQKGLVKSLWTPHIQHTPSLNCYHLVNATELWSPERPDTETVSSLRQSISWTLDIKRGTHNTIIQLFIHHTYLFFHFKFAHQTSHIIICIAYCVFTILYIAYLYIVILLSVSCPVAVILLCCGASVTKTNS